jgi:hypothetical protein
VKKTPLFLLIPIFGLFIFLSAIGAEDKKSEAVAKYLFPVAKPEKENKQEEKKEEGTTWGEVGRATLRGGIKGSIGGPYKSAAGAIIDGGKEVIKKQSEDDQRDLEKGALNRSYKARWTQEGLQPGQPGYLSDKEKKKAQQQLERKDSK